MRLWLTPYRYKKHPIWLGQISRVIGVNYSRRTLITHAIDPDVDETRNGLVGDLAYSQALGAVGFVKGSQRSSLDETHFNQTPDPLKECPYDLYCSEIWWQQCSGFGAAA
jgi:hypothetical protein